MHCLLWFHHQPFGQRRAGRRWIMYRGDSERLKNIVSEGALDSKVRAVLPQEQRGVGMCPEKRNVCFASGTMLVYHIYYSI